MFKKHMKVKVILIIIIAAEILVLLSPIPGLTRGSISYNTGLTLAQSARVFDNNRVFDLHAPDQAHLKNIIMHLFFFFGRDEFIIRLPAMLFGISSILLIFLLGSAVFDEKAGLLSAFLLSASLWHIHYSANAEMYSLFVFMALSSAYFFYKSMERDSLILTVCFIVSTALGFYAFYPFIMILAAEVLFFLLFSAKCKKKLFRFMLSVEIIGVLILPGLVQAYEGIIWKSNFGDYAWGWKIQEVFPFFLNTFGGIRNFFPVNIFLFLLGFSVCIFKKTERRKGVFLFLLWAFPCIFFLACFFIFNANITARYFLFASPFFIILASYGILSLKNKALIAGMVLVFCSSTLFFVLSSYSLTTEEYIPEDYRRHYADFRSLADYLKQSCREEDAIIIIQGPGILATQYYLDMKNTSPIEAVIPSCGADIYYRYDGSRVKNFFGIIEFEFAQETIESNFRNYERLWLVDLHHILHTDKDGKMQEWVDANSSKEYEFDGGIVYLFGNKAKMQQSNVQEGSCSKKGCSLNCRPLCTIPIYYPFEKEQ